MAGLREGGGILEVAKAAGKGTAMRSTGVGSVWWTAAASLRVDQSPGSLPKAKALGSEVLRVASCRERGVRPGSCPRPLLSALPPEILRPGAWPGLIHQRPRLRAPRAPVVRKFLAPRDSHFPPAETTAALSAVRASDQELGTQVLALSLARICQMILASSLFPSGLVSPSVK